MIRRFPVHGMSRGRVLKRALGPIVMSGMALATSSMAWAQDVAADPRWTASVSLSASQGESETEDDARLTSGSIALERTFDGFALGAEIASSGGDAIVPDVLTVADSSSFQGSLWWNGAVGPVDLALTGGLGRQALDGAATAPATAPPILRGRSVAVDATVESASVGLSASHTWGEAWRVTPRISVSYDRSRLSVEAHAPSTGGIAFRADEVETGVTGTLGVTVARSVSRAVDLSAILTGLATDNAAAGALSSSQRPGSLSQLARQSGGSEEWGDVSLAANVATGSRTAISLAIGTSFGRETDEAHASLGASWGF